MKLKFDTQKIAEAGTSFLQKTSDTGKKAVSEVQKGAIAFSDKAKQDAYLRKLKKYNPLFPEVYHSNDFCVPNMIVIVDDAVRRGIDVCEGAIGWRSNKNGMEVLYLYDEAVAESGLQFIPAPVCDTAYYIDRFCRNRFIQVDCIFSIAHTERLAELEHVAHALGAKRCTIEISEARKTSSSEHTKVSLHERISIKGVSASSDESAEHSAVLHESSSRKGSVHTEFEGSDTPKRPTLKWFANDDSITQFIEMRCSGENPPKEKSFSLSGTASSTMSQKTACAIDGALSKMKLSGNSKMESQAITESSMSMVFRMEF